MNRSAASAEVASEVVRAGHGAHLVTAPSEAAMTLADELARTIEGEVRFDAGSRALYATAGSNYRQVPIGVVLPKTKEDVVATLAACRRHGAPVLSRGGGTSLAGQCCNVAVVMDMGKYLHGIVEIDPNQRTATVLPGTILDTLRDAAVEHDLTYAPDPATHNHCTLGGMIGNNSCGVHSVMAGRTADNVIELEIITYEGDRMRVGATSEEELEAIIHAGGRRARIYRALRSLRDRYADLIRARYPKIPRRVSGYNLDDLLPESGFHVARALVGTEGTCVTVLEAKLRLVPWPRSRSLLVLGYPDVYSAGDHVSEIMSFGPIALEGLDDLLVDYIHRKGLHERYVKYLPEGRGFLMAEFGGDTREESDANARRAMDALRRRPNAPAMKLYDDPDQEHKLWKVRESGLGATARVPGLPDTWEGWEDSAVPPDRLGDYLRDLRTLFHKHGYEASLYGHFGQGCVHTRIPFDFTSERGVANYRSFLDDATSLVVSYGGSLSGEHGDGQSRAEFLPKMFGPELVTAFGEFKAIWDPDKKMNPGKIVDPYKITDNLRLGPSFHHPALETHFHYPDDDGDFTRATLRCVGVGECRRLEGGTMCPSYMVTREEMHSTRGRAHLLFEMIRGDDLDGWQDEHIRESLDLCLACKGCKGDCPINVDVATYKAEFLSHYFEKHFRPRAAWSMGRIRRWVTLASLAPGLANWITQTPGIAALAKKIAGIAPERVIPRFPPHTFKHEFFARIPRNVGGPEVMLWPDTWNDHFFPETAMAAVEVLEAAGYHVVVPKEPICCGRPLYDFGFLAAAKKLLERDLRTLRGPIEAGMPIVALEPSCLSVLRDEAHSFFPNDDLVNRMRKQTYLFGEFLRERPGALTLPRLERKAEVHGHCHHKSLWTLADEEEVLHKMGMDAHTIDSGCCGMAGSFGFEEGTKYEVSIQCGERSLLPEVRSAEKSTLIIADGFSCREQIRQTTNRTALHLAEVVRMAMLHGPEGPAGDHPEQYYVRADAEYARLTPAKAAAFGAGVVAIAGMLDATRRAKRRLSKRRVERRKKTLIAALSVSAAIIGTLVVGTLRRSARSSPPRRNPSPPPR